MFELKAIGDGMPDVMMIPNMVAGSFVEETGLLTSLWNGVGVGGAAIGPLDGSSCLRITPQSLQGIDGMDVIGPDWERVSLPYLDSAVTICPEGAIGIPMCSAISEAP